MATKQKEKKIADPIFREPREIPEYKRPFSEFQKEVREGDRVRLEVRAYDQDTDSWYLFGVTGKVVEIYEKGFRWFDDDEKKKRAKPWWGVHNWEILDA